MPMKKNRAQQENLPIKLKITLENMPLSVFRVVLVPDIITMEELHVIIQVAMGWEFAHLFQFCDKKQNPTIIVSDEGEDDEPMDDMFGEMLLGLGVKHHFQKEKLPENVLLKEEFMLQRERKPFYYWYDFGDDWWHKITFQKPSKKDLAAFNGMPVCVDAFGACPPEDCGGPWGYSDLLDALTNKKHGGYEEAREWMGLSKRDKFDPDYADIDQINARMQDFFELQ